MSGDGAEGATKALDRAAGGMKREVGLVRLVGDTVGEGRLLT